MYIVDKSNGFENFAVLLFEQLEKVLLLLLLPLALYITVRYISAFVRDWYKVHVTRVKNNINSRMDTTDNTLK